ncbi:MAG TPA: hypothetical protein VNU24_01900, partial [Solirubrobacteraceae bacterium]|nr:hypothetical protein [Solirubrobacteraceae bacterium]
PPSELDPALDPAVPVDPLRLTLGFGAYQMSGFEIAKHLMKVGVVPEKAGVQTVTLAVPVDDDGKFSECVATEMIGLLAWRLPDTLRPELPNPLLGIGMEPVINPASAIERSLVDGIFVPLEEAAGGVCLEFIEVYPDSIPIAIPGFPLSRQAVAYLGAVVGAGGSIVSLVPGKASVLLESETL